MAFNPQTWLKQELASIAVVDEQTLLQYIPLAARLAALGEGGPLARWRQLAAPFKDRVAPCLADRCREGIWDLDQSLGEDLGQSIIEAQDFHCFARREADILPAQASLFLQVWADEAEAMLPDEEAAEVLREFLGQFPLPADDRLDVVDTPLTELMLAFSASQAQARPTIEAHWPAVEQPQAELVDYGGPHPSDRLIRDFERLAVSFHVPQVGPVQVSRRLRDDWHVLIDVEGQDDAPLVEMVRLGRLPGLPASGAPNGSWTVDLRPFEHAQRLALLDEPLVVNFPGGQRLQIV